jgi:hypothetical protein
VECFFQSQFGRLTHLVMQRCARRWRLLVRLNYISLYEKDREVESELYLSLESRLFIVKKMTIEILKHVSGNLPTRGDCFRS